MTVDGAGSGLDADLLDGLSSASFANAAFANTDYTTISATAAVYGNSNTIPVVTLTANGRVSSIVNTAIQTGSTTQSGIIQLTDSITSTSTTTAATANSAKRAYETAVADALALSIALG